METALVVVIWLLVILVAIVVVTAIVNLIIGIKVAKKVRKEMSEIFLDYEKETKEVETKVKRKRDDR